MTNNKDSANHYQTLAKLLDEQYQSRVEMCQQLASHLENGHKREASGEEQQIRSKKATNHGPWFEIEKISALTPEQILQHLLDNMKK
jgi:hypothetical protein